jgi:hypothetical protein
VPRAIAHSYITQEVQKELFQEEKSDGFGFAMVEILMLFLLFIVRNFLFTENTDSLTCRF